MNYWTAFVLGIMGSFHCLGMCGPIVLALPGQYSATQKFLFSRLLYNFGRTITYAFMGLIIGSLGSVISFTGLQRPVSIALGLIIIIGVITPREFIEKVSPFNFLQTVTSKLKFLWGRLFTTSSYSGMLSLGILNGFLPCGLVYMALAGALSTDTVTGAVSYMVLFGLGTIPMLLAVAIAGNVLGIKTRRFVTRLFPYMAILIGVLFILRGLGLGIPYISPPAELGQTSSEMNCH